MVLAHNLNENHRTNDVQISQDVLFDAMLLSSNTLEGLKRSGFIRPSPIQLHGIPLGKCGFDLLLEAKSGTGKTAVFSVIALEKLDLDKGLQVIILAPTREIAAQICDVLRQIGSQYNGLCVEVVMGGFSVQDDIEKFKERKVHIVVGSPGRLKHLISDKYMDISAARLLVLDEADKLMEKSFLTDIKFIYLSMPCEKQVIMSSATYPESCKEFIDEFVQDAQHICPNSDCVLLGIAQKVTYVKYNSNTVLQTRNRFKELLKIITRMQFKQCVIFCNYQTRVADVYKMLIREKWPAEQLFGAQDQTERLGALKMLQEYKCRILISTDLAARGIDASNVDLVINFEPPFEWQTYLHRIGRAGRFGTYGMAITILSEGVEQKKFMTLLSAANGTIKLTPLWKEFESNNNDSEQIETPEALDHLQLIDCKEEQCIELWNIICNTENSLDKENIESFPELFMSYQDMCNTSNDNIESFAELYSSFQNNHFLDTKDSSYKCIKWPNTSSKQFLIGIKSNVPDIYKQKDDSLNKISKCDNERIMNNMQSEKMENNSNSKFINKNSIPKSENSSFSNQEILLNSEESNLSTIKTDVSRLNKNNHDLCQKDNFSLNKKQSCSRSNDDIKNVKSEKLKTKLSYSNANAQLKKSTNNNLISVQNSDSNRFRNSTTCETNKVYPTKDFSNISYNNWCKQLKLRVRQIEQAIYIEELGKLF